MISVFIAFVFGGQRVIAEFGIGLAAAVAIDALILRTVLVPAIMHLFGPANWWLPSVGRRAPAPPGRRTDVRRGVRRSVEAQTGREPARAADPRRRTAASGAPPRVPP